MARRKARVQDGLVFAPEKKRAPKILVFPAIIAVLAFFIYAPTLGSAWTSTDDTELVVDDVAFLTSDGALLGAFRRPFFPQPGRRTYYRPLVTLSFVMDTPHGEPPNAETFHRTNAFLHAGASALVFFLAEALGLPVIAATGAAVLFALHPVTAQAIAWIPGRCDALFAVFALGSLLAWLRFDRTASHRALALHLALLAAALFSKEAAVALPVVMLAYTLFVSRNGRVVRDPFVWIGWSMVCAFWFVARRGAIVSIASGTSVGTVLGNSAALPIGLGKLLVPIELDVLSTLRDSSRLPGLAALALLGGATVAIDSARRRLFIWAAVLFPLALLVPALAVADFLILDNRLYLPLAGVAVGAGIVAESSAVRWPRTKTPLVVAGVGLSVALAIGTLRHAESFESARAFSEAAVRGSPHLGLAHLNLGAVDFREGHLDEAQHEFERALEENPTEPVAHNDLGLVFLNTGDFVRAENEFLTELRANPNYSKAHFNLGLVFERTGRADLARDEFERVVALAPRDTDAWGELFKYWAPRDPARADAIERKMEELGVRFFSP